MVDLGTGEVKNYAVPPEQWKVHLFDTGQATMTGGRIKRMEEWLRSPEAFIVTYGDGLADIDLHALVSFHKSHGKLATVTAVRPPARYGMVQSISMATVLSHSAKSRKPAKDGSTAVLWSLTKGFSNTYTTTMMSWNVQDWNVLRQMAS